MQLLFSGEADNSPSPTTNENESFNLLERIHGDICGPIDPSYGPFKYFMVLIDTLTRWSHVCVGGDYGDIMI